MLKISVSERHWINVLINVCKMFNENEESQISELKKDFKMKHLEKIIKDYIDEGLDRFVEKVRKLEQGKKPPLSIQQLADRYEVSKATVHNWMKQRLIIGFKMGKGRFFHIEEVEKSLSEYRYSNVLERNGMI